METIDLILKITQDTQTTLDNHIKIEDAKFDAVIATQNTMKSDIGTLKTDVALSKQRTNLITSAIAVIVSGFTAWFANWFGFRS